MPIFLKFIFSPTGLAVMGVLALVGVLAYITNEAYDRGVDDTAAHYEQELAKQREANNLQLIETERQLAQALADAAATHEERLSHVKEKSNAIIADLRADNIRVRDRFRCPAVGVSQATSDTGQRDDPPSGGLHRDDAEFLVRLAERADRVTIQLNTCQGVLTSLRAITNAEIAE